jgi:UDP:flavonoid glycosyltransferase YjiC (YdhE family)
MRILFSCISSEGHFSPLLPLARALTQRGHDVVFAVAEPWRYRAEEEGFASVAAGPAMEDMQVLFAPERERIFQLPVEERRPLQFSSLFGGLHAPAKLPDLLRVATDEQVAAIVYDSGDLAVPIAAAALGIPAVNHSFGGMIPLAALRLAADVVAPLWREHGLEPDPYAGAFRGLYVDLAPPSFAWEQPLGKRVTLRPAADAVGEPPAWLDELPSPFVYVTLGTVWNRPEVFEVLLQGLDGVAALVTTGRNLDPATLGPAPPRVRLERFVPQAHVLERAAAVVSHGGSGTTLGSLARGLPLVLVPQAADQFDNAARAERAGAAVVLRPGEVTPESVRAALDRVLGDPAVAEAARTIAAEIAEMASAEEAAATVEGHVAAG